MRILSWNLERLARYLPPLQGELPFGPQTKRYASLEQIFAHFQRPTWVCLQEVRLRQVDTGLIAAARSAVPGYEASLHLCNDPLNAKSAGGRHYGVAMYRCIDAPEAVFRTLPWDREGRVLIAEIPSAGLALVNWYGVNGTDKTYWDPTTRAADGDRHAFKLRSQEMLQQACAELARTYRLIVIGDINVTPAACDIHPRLRRTAPHVEARRFMQEVFKPGLGLVDVYRHLYPERRQYTWFNRAVPKGRLDAARVDYAMISESLLPQVEDAAIYDDVSERFGSDHAPIDLRLRL